MKALHRGFTVRGKSLSSRNVSFPGFSNVAARLSIPMASMRHQNTATDRLKTSPWSQHPFPVSTPSKTDDNEPSKPSLSAKRRAYIALGSNLGDRIGWIEKACNEITARGIKITRTSSLWETEPMYVLDQDSFINGACEVRSDLFAISTFPRLGQVQQYWCSEDLSAPPPVCDYHIGYTLALLLTALSAGRDYVGAPSPLR